MSDAPFTLATEKAWIAERAPAIKAIDEAYQREVASLPIKIRLAHWKRLEAGMAYGESFMIAKAEIEALNG